MDKKEKAADKGEVTNTPADNKKDLDYCTNKNYSEFVNNVNILCQPERRLEIRSSRRVAGFIGVNVRKEEQKMSGIYMIIDISPPLDAEMLSDLIYDRIYRRIYRRNRRLLWQTIIFGSEAHLTKNFGLRNERDKSLLNLINAQRENMESGSNWEPVRKIIHNNVSYGLVKALILITDFRFKDVDPVTVIDSLMNRQKIRRIPKLIISAGINDAAKEVYNKTFKKKRVYTEFCILDPQDEPDN